MVAAQVAEVRQGGVSVLSRLFSNHCNILVCRSFRTSRSSSPCESPSGVDTGMHMRLWSRPSWIVALWSGRLPYALHLHQFVPSACAISL